MYGQGTVRERRPGVWELIVELERDALTGKRQRRSRVFRGSKSEAVKAVTAMRAEVLAGRVGARNGATVHDLLERWLELVERDLSPTTLHEYRRLTRTRIEPALGAVAVERVTTAQLDRFYRALVDEGGLSPASVRQVHAIVRRALRQAVKWGWIASNPAANTTPPRIVRAEITPPGVAELRRLVAGADAHDDALGVFVRLAIATGMRRGELCALRWSDLDEKARVLHVRRAVVSVGTATTEKQTKTHASRRVALDQATVDALRAHRQRGRDALRACGGSVPADAYIFSDDVDGARPWPPDKVTGAFRRLCTRLGLSGFRFHDLRHAHATQLLAAGVPVRTVSGRLGHANASTTLNVYAHVLEASDRHAAELAGSLLDG